MTASTNNVRLSKGHCSKRRLVLTPVLFVTEDAEVSVLVSRFLYVSLCSSALNLSLPMPASCFVLAMSRVSASSGDGRIRR